MASGVIATPTSERTNVIAAAKASRAFTIRVNCKAIGVPGMAANSKIPILASVGNEETRTKMTELRKETMDKVTGVLTADQKKAWKEMTGEPFQVQFQPRNPN